MKTRAIHTDGTPLMSLNEAAAWGITHLRKPKWVDPFDHLVQSIHEGKPAIWLNLFCPFNLECNGRDPVKIMALKGAGLRVDPDAPLFVPYRGPMADSPEYHAAVAKYAGCLSEASR